MRCGQSSERLKVAFDKRGRCRADSIPDARLESFPEDQLQPPASGSRLQVPLAALGVLFREKVLAENQAERTARSGGLRFAMEVLGQAALEIGGEADVESVVMHGQQDIDAVLKLRRHADKDTNSARREATLDSEIEKQGQWAVQQMPCIAAPPYSDAKHLLYGSGGWGRTSDQRINSPLRYHCATPEQREPFPQRKSGRQSITLRGSVSIPKKVKATGLFHIRF